MFLYSFNFGGNRVIQMTDSLQYYMFYVCVESGTEYRMSCISNFVVNLYFFFICGANVANVLNSFVEKATVETKVINLGGSSNLHVLIPHTTDPTLQSLQLI
jgi:hypothetical protein